jgi:hypothetical protein
MRKRRNLVGLGRTSPFLSAGRGGESGAHLRWEKTICYATALGVPSTLTRSKDHATGSSLFKLSLQNVAAYE